MNKIRSIVAQISASTLSGVFLGTSLGLSQSPLIASVVAALLPVIASFLFISSRSKLAIVRLNPTISIFLSVFLLFTITTMLASSYYRSSSTSIASLQQQLLNLEVPPDVALCVILERISGTNSVELAELMSNVRLYSSDSGGSERSACIDLYTEFVQRAQSTQRLCAEISASMSSQVSDDLMTQMDASASMIWRRAAQYLRNLDTPESSSPDKHDVTVEIALKILYGVFCNE